MGRVPGLEKMMAGSSPMRRLATPEEIAAAVVWLCSDAASFVTGHVEQNLIPGNQRRGIADANACGFADRPQCRILINDIVGDDWLRDGRNISLRRARA